MNWIGGGGGNVGLIKNSMLRYFSRQRAVNVRKINPKVPFPEAALISQSLYNIIKERGPLSIANTWNYAKEANISGLNSKTHMKIMLKWMRGRKMLKFFCNHVGSSKKFLHSTLPEEPRSDQSKVLSEPNLQTEKPSRKRKQK
ncbi:uncharacterized protein LOC8278490 [Ricinus communis]|uniref:Uncharacterized protein n=1 Tax=Ricinus communis TaxID=3988 RepID=B9RYZ3_RICCO|nr:uncharacterized protein LOC8278490 [Ricinus communis]EEF43495.1 conserved hypothetical protein [Ricinus communis]|eukprot:XP_002518962.1 uncharacterized protein LOC8278490 [Ricinus communis]